MGSGQAGVKPTHVLLTDGSHLIENPGQHTHTQGKGPETMATTPEPSANVPYNIMEEEEGGVVRTNRVQGSGSTVLRSSAQSTPVPRRRWRPRAPPSSAAACTPAPARGERSRCLGATRRRGPWGPG